MHIVSCTGAKRLTGQSREPTASLVHSMLCSRLNVSLACTLWRPYRRVWNAAVRHGWKSARTQRRRDSVSGLIVDSRRATVFCVWSRTSAARWTVWNAVGGSRRGRLGPDTRQWPGPVGNRYPSAAGDDCEPIPVSRRESSPVKWNSAPIRAPPGRPRTQDDYRWTSETRCSFFSIGPAATHPPVLL